MIDLELCRTLSSVQIGLMDHPILASELLREDEIDFPVLRVNLFEKANRFSSWGKSVMDRHVVLQPLVREWLEEQGIVASLYGECITKKRLQQDAFDPTEVEEAIVGISFLNSDDATAFTLRWL